MTKKDYELIARSLEATIRFYSRIDSLVMQRGAKQAAYELADALGEDNPRFDRNKFLQACGIGLERLGFNLPQDPED